MPVLWQVDLVPDELLTEEWAIVTIEGVPLPVALAGKAGVEREPGRITSEVVAELDGMLPPDPPASPDGSGPQVKVVGAIERYSAKPRPPEAPRLYSVPVVA